MSSAKPSCMLEPPPSSTELRDELRDQLRAEVREELRAEMREELREEHDRFCAELADGLHALAQPLTIVRSAIALLAAAGENGAHPARYVDMSARQMERTCQIFASVQGLLATRLVPAACEPLDLPLLFARIAQDHASKLAERGIRLEQSARPLPEPVVADRLRTEQAIAAALQTAISASSSGDVIQMDTSQSDESFEVRLQSTCRTENSLNSFDRLHLSLARANMLSQHGGYRFTPEPFCIALMLPARQPQLEKNEHIDYTACTD